MSPGGCLGSVMGGLTPGPEDTLLPTFPHSSLFEMLPLQIEEDAYQEDLGFSLGHLGKSGSGRVRQTQVNEATKARISKTLQVWGKGSAFCVQSGQGTGSTIDLGWEVG